MRFAPGMLRPSRARSWTRCELEKLELYQRRYQEYVRIAKALRALTT